MTDDIVMPPVIFFVHCGTRVFCTTANLPGLSPSVPDKCKNNGGFTRIPRMSVCQTDAPSFCYVSNMTPKLTRGPMGLSPRSPDPCHAMPCLPHDFFIALNVHARWRRMAFFHTGLKRGQRPSRSSSFLSWKMPRVILLASHVLPPSVLVLFSPVGRCTNDVC